MKRCPKCQTVEGVHGGCDCGFLKAWKPTKYESSVLTCHDAGDDECKTCRFLSGDTSTEILLHVIKLLDRRLAVSESVERMIAEAGGIPAARSI